MIAVIMWDHTRSDTNFDFRGTVKDVFAGVAANGEAGLVDENHHHTFFMVAFCVDLSPLDKPDHSRYSLHLAIFSEERWKVPINIRVRSL